MPEDGTADESFYREPRLVTHIDEGAIAACTELYRELIPPAGAVLDLMSSWRSHLPDNVPYERVVGLGMNADEMRQNPQLTASVVHNLNEKSELPFADAEFDAAICTVSVQYMRRPVETFGEVNRVVKTGGAFAVTFSNRCFPTKAIAAWRQLSDEEHMRLVALYFERSGGWRDLQAKVLREGRYGISDPLYAVWARRA